MSFSSCGEDRIYVCWQDRDFKVLKPCLMDISAPSCVSRPPSPLTNRLSTHSLPAHQAFSESYNSHSLVLLWTPCPQAEMEVCNDRSGKNYCLHWDNIHQLTDDNIWWQNIDVTPKCICAKVLLHFLCLWTGNVWFEMQFQDLHCFPLLVPLSIQKQVSRRHLSLSIHRLFWQTTLCCDHKITV